MPLNLEDPAPIKMLKIDWVVVTRENFDKVFADLEKKGIDPVIIGLTDEGYQTLSVNTAQTRKYIILQKEVTKKYREYYEAKDGAKETPTR
jgi:hypothetical protein